MFCTCRPVKFLALVVTFVSTHSFAQTFYEPVRYQYGDRCNVYYYGGTDPRVHAHANSPAFARQRGFAYASAGVDAQREVSNEPVRVFVDELPFRNAAVYGVTPSDAANTSNASVPLYFRKRDLVTTGVTQADGTVTVPSQMSSVAPGVRITPSAPRVRVAPFPRPILVIPLRPMHSDAPAGPARL